MSRVAQWLAPVLMLPSSAWASMPECDATQASVPVVSGVMIEEVQSDDAKLKLVRVMALQGAFMHIYFDQNSEADARRYADCLGSQLNLLANELLDERKGAQWASVVLPLT